MIPIVIQIAKLSASNELLQPFMASMTQEWPMKNTFQLENNSVFAFKSSSWSTADARAVQCEEFYSSPYHADMRRYSLSNFYLINFIQFEALAVVVPSGSALAGD